MEKRGSPIPKAARLALEEFAESLIQDPQDILRLEQLQGEQPPKTSLVLVRGADIPSSLEWQFEEVVEASTPGYLERRSI